MNPFPGNDLTMRGGGDEGVGRGVREDEGGHG
jgi:hypothetical protein